MSPMVIQIMEYPTAVVRPRYKVFPSRYGEVTKISQTKEDTIDDAAAKAKARKTSMNKLKKYNAKRNKKFTACLVESTSSAHSD